MRLLADEDFDFRVVLRLRALGHDVLTVMEAQRRGLGDEEQLTFATSEQRALLTFNRADFHALHRRRPDHAGIITCTRGGAAMGGTRLPSCLVSGVGCARGPGCYHVGPSPFPFLWIAANELPLAEELIPFLIARSGRALDEFCLWVKARRPPEWLTRMVELLPMSIAVYEELLRFGLTKSDDPEVNDRKRRMVRVLVDTTPEVRAELLDEGQLKGERASLRRVLARRGIALAGADEARIERCTDLDTLLRWLDQALVARDAAEALR